MNFISGNPAVSLWR